VGASGRPRSAMTRCPLISPGSFCDEETSDHQGVHARTEESVNGKERPEVRFGGRCRSRNQTFLAECDSRFETDRFPRFRIIIYRHRWPVSLIRLAISCLPSVLLRVSEDTSISCGASVSKGASQWSAYPHRSRNLRYRTHHKNYREDRSLLERNGWRC